MKLRILGLAMGVALSGMISMGAMSGVAYAAPVPATAEGGGTPAPAADDGGGGAAATSVNCPNGSKRGTAPTYADCNLPEEAEMPTKDVPTVAQTIISVLTGAVGIVAVLVIVIGGILYVTSTGDTAKTKRAQSTILYGVIGLVVAVLAYAIVNFVLKSVFS